MMFPGQADLPVFTWQRFSVSYMHLRFPSICSPPQKELEPFWAGSYSKPKQQLHTHAHTGGSVFIHTLLVQ